MIKGFYNREKYLYAFAILVSCVLSFWLTYRESLINPDAICYLLSAQAVGQSGISAAMHLCGQAEWPFYPILIHALATVSHLSYPLTAYLVDGLFSAISVLTFILIVKELGGTKRILWLAALVILLAHEFNAVRQYIVRDHGFWAFYLCSIWLLLSFVRKPSLLKALTWNMCLLIATLFRIEGIIFLALVPFVIWLVPSFSLIERFKRFIELNLITLMAGVSVIFWALLHPEATSKLGRLLEIPHQLQHGLMAIVGRFYAAKAGIVQHVLTSEAERDAGLVLFLIWISMYFITLVKNLSLGYTLLVIYAWKNHVVNFTTKARCVLFAYLGVNVFITLGFLAERMFLSRRYVIALLLVLMFWIPFALNDLLKKWPSARHRLFLIIVSVLILISSVGGIIDFGYSKTYIRQAGDWLSINVPADASLYANDIQVMYYSHHFGEKVFQKVSEYRHTDILTTEQWKQYDYIALRLGKNEEGYFANLANGLPLTPIQTFTNKRGDRVVIYRVK